MKINTKVVPAIMAGKNQDGSYCPTNDADSGVLLSPDAFELVPDAEVKPADGNWPLNSASAGKGHVIVGEQVWRPNTKSA